MFLPDFMHDLLDEIVRGYKPEKVYLFGSYAINTANPDSDIDLFIIKETKSRKKDRPDEVRKVIKNYPPVGLDIIVYTPDELKSGNEQLVDIGKEAVKTGKLLYERV